MYSVLDDLRHSKDKGGPPRMKRPPAPAVLDEEEPHMLKTTPRRNHLRFRIKRQPVNKWDDSYQPQLVQDCWTIKSSDGVTMKIYSIYLLSRCLSSCLANPWHATGATSKDGRNWYIGSATERGTMLLREFEVRIQDIPNHLSLINFNSECEMFHHLAIWICEIQFLPIQASTATPNWLTPVWSGPLMVYSLWWMYDGLCTSSSTGSIWWCPKCLETVRLPLSHNVQHDSAPPVESIGPLFTMCLIVFPNGHIP